MNLLTVSSGFITVMFFTLGWSFTIFTSEQMEIKCLELKSFSDYIYQQKIFGFRLMDQEVNCSSHQESFNLIMFKALGGIILFFGTLAMQKIQFACFFLLLLQFLETFVFNLVSQNQSIHQDQLTLNISIIGAISMYFLEVRKSKQQEPEQKKEEDHDDQQSQNDESSQQQQKEDSAQGDLDLTKQTQKSQIIKTKKLKENKDKES